MPPNRHKPLVHWSQEDARRFIGPGEAREADVGIAGGKGKGILFKKGLKIRTVPEENLVEALMEEVNKMVTGDE